MAESRRCPGCGGAVTRNHTHRNGWYYADCGRRYHWGRDEWEPSAPASCLRRQLSASKAEADTLRAIIEAKLSRTADGTWVGLLDEVWYGHDFYDRPHEPIAGIVVEAEDSPGGIYAVQLQLPGNNPGIRTLCERPVRQCWSTAALAAAKATAADAAEPARVGTEP